MPYFCENPECRCHTWFNDDRQLMRVIDGVKEDTFTLKEIGHKKVANTISMGDVFNLCDDCVAKLSEPSTSDNYQIRRWYHNRLGG